ncbi:MAG: UDP-N-acetylmuramate dehydrogenase [Rubinisphaera brasiliensis]|uniref:UDP-N-acetylenolpyruvoylglucosamine reductase n=1 Tax=Rubinisphaera brasiliensis (strain ATCC 49424 / DSM 5305 / JCM 21570 / IAM 15109 / NBRC 103401 / IFAM 1448) TaxID=756272 RepID=F0SQW6_RUBBR|nr:MULTISPECIES: UDP-N-acetylmuramate dehydrogenase [Rubinisphaera]ADY60187.1 UDP-N-acetylmuramate dehydrogenase [Rubinisphaera brasiliensis DSM 5305]MBB02889.1 UDP-N-acetylenolpyruvoylglucosamine reductase [Planctomyces sp.]
MNCLDKFADITRRDELLAPYTWLKLGGPAQYFIEPRSVEELCEVVKCCQESDIPLHVLGDGSNLLIRDEGVSGAVLRLSAGDFADVSIEGTEVKAGAGAALSHVISRAVAAGLTGLEDLAGIPGTIGGAIVGNAGGRSGELGSKVTSIDVITHRGEVETIPADLINFQYRGSHIDAPVVLSATLQLEQGDPNEITRRLRKTWIMKKASQPLSSQSAGCIFKNPRGLSAGALIEQAGLKGTRIGDCEVSDVHANFIITHENTTSDDILRLIDLVQSKVEDENGVELELEVKVWPH